MRSPELAVVLPVYNEEGAVEGVIGAWVKALDDLGVDYEIHAYDDGSTDATPRLLGALARAHPRLRVHRRRNAGHGPTVLRGYRDNAATPWIFQVDSDDEMGPEGFAELWRRRADYDLLVGERAGRAQDPGRRWLSAGSRAAVRLLFGSAVRDVNAPYRLLRTERFREVFRELPNDTFAPNLIVSGMAARLGLRCFTTPVAHRARRTGQVSIRRLALLRAALRAGAQTLRLRIALARIGS